MRLARAWHKAAQDKVGATLEALVRHGQEVRPARNPVGQLLRMLAPSA